MVFAGALHLLDSPPDKLLAACVIFLDGGGGGGGGVSLLKRLPTRSCLVVNLEESFALDETISIIFTKKYETKVDGLCLQRPVCFWFQSSG